MRDEYLSFKLHDEFINQYVNKKVDWGYQDGAGNSIGEITFYRTYSRKKADGNKEKWFEVCRRVVEGMYSILKDHCRSNRLPWNEKKAQNSATEAFDRMFNFKWLPPGRGLWMMGTPFVHKRHNSAALQNCSFVSTSDMTKFKPETPFAFLMEASMLGVGVGFDTEGAKKDFTIYEPVGTEDIIIEDSREGWVNSMSSILRSYLVPNHPRPIFDFSLVRAAGEPIRGFGGVAAGPIPLMDLHSAIDKLFISRAGETLTSRDIVDIANHIGCCVVAGNVRRSAELALGDADDEEFLNLKNYKENPDRAAFGWVSNNSIKATVGGQDYDKIVPRIIENGEPGLIYMDVTRAYSRLVDPPDNKDHRIMGFNPCAEQPLESYEMCVSGDTLIQTRSGVSPIEKLVGQPVEIWNGERWSEVVPFDTGINDLYRITLSDGSILETTPGHEWLTKTRTEVKFKTRKTTDLKVGMILPEFELGEVDGKPVDNSYELGWFVGDGYLDSNRPMGIIQTSEKSILDTMKVAAIYPEQNNRSENNTTYSRVSFVGIVRDDVAIDLRNHYNGLPPEILNMNQESILEFVAGWIDTDGSLIKNPNTDHYVLYSSEKKLRDLQILLRRIGINHSTLRLFKPKGHVTNFGTRNYGLWRLLIPSYESSIIPTRLKKATRFGSRFGKNPRYDGITIDRARKQKIVSIGKIPSQEMTYCFTEDNNHQGVFGNVLTKQCTLVEAFPTKHEDETDFLRTLKFAYMYGKAVTLIPTHWPETNAVMQRNRRIGLSVSGLAEFVEKSNWTELRTWLNDGYSEVQSWDKVYSDWLGIRESIKTTTVKPSGSVSLLAGTTPGAHWPTNDTYIRRMRLGANDPLTKAMFDAGYKIEQAVGDTEATVVVEIPVHGKGIRTEKDVSIFEKMQLAVLAQRYWSDNGVSLTVTFDPVMEGQRIGDVLRMYEGQLKAVSFLPIRDDAYAQMPYEAITDEQYEETSAGLKKLSWVKLYKNGGEALGEKYCSTDFCEIPLVS